MAHDPDEFREKLVDCRKCGVERPQTEFRRHSRCRTGYERTCIPCHRVREAARYQADKRKHRDRHLRRTYGISIDEYDAMAEAQGGGCAICGGPPDRENFDVDHCHITGEVRALLCAPCNRGLGDFRDDPDLLLKAAAYLTEHQR